MELLKFNSAKEFSDWFTEEIQEEYPLVKRYSRTAKNENVTVYRAMDNNDIVGITFLECIDSDNYKIRVFEINSELHRNGLGTEMFNLLKKEMGDAKNITLNYAGVYGGEAYMFWTKMGFFANGRRSHEMKFGEIPRRELNERHSVSKAVPIGKVTYLDYKDKGLQIIRESY